MSEEVIGNLAKAANAAIEQAVQDRWDRLVEEGLFEKKLEEYLQSVVTDNDRRPGIPGNVAQAVLVTTFIPSYSSADGFKKAGGVIDKTLRREWVERTMAVFAKHFGGATNSGEAEGLFILKKNETEYWPAEAEPAAVIQSYAAISEIMNESVMEDLGNLMLGMAHELGQFQTLLVIGGWRFQIENPERLEPPGPSNALTLEKRGLLGPVKDWPFVQKAHALMGSAFDDAESRKSLRASQSSE